jgi:hypothetical protein
VQHHNTTKYNITHHNSMTCASKGRRQPAKQSNIRTRYTVYPGDPTRIHPRGKSPSWGLSWGIPLGDSPDTLGNSPANLLISQGVMATLQERRLGYHSRAGLEPGISGVSSLRINHYAARGMLYRTGYFRICVQHYVITVQRPVVCLGRQRG